MIFLDDIMQNRNWCIGLDYSNPRQMEMESIMSQMSPLGSILMTILKKGSWGAGAFIALCIGIVVWQSRQPDGSFAMKPEDWKFIVLLVGMLLLAAYLVRSIGKEMDPPEA
jgi:hypothetical protein